LIGCPQSAIPTRKPIPYNFSFRALYPVRLRHDRERTGSCATTLEPLNMNSEEIARLIESGLPDCNALVRSDDNTHFEAVVVSSGFEGKRSLARHQMVYATLGELVGGEIHALSIKAFTPDEWETVGGGN
jgi:acid stress-induced BolA-like protein IbaG/YrbA